MPYPPGVSNAHFGIEQALPPRPQVTSPSLFDELFDSDFFGEFTWGEDGKACLELDFYVSPSTSAAVKDEVALLFLERVAAKGREIQAKGMQAQEGSVCDGAH